MKASSLHGGNVYRAARERGWAISRLVDFSASINPLGPSPAAVQAWRNALPQLVHYPDPDCTALRQVLAARWHLAPESILVGNGSSELIHLLPRALGIRHALLIGPTFSEYERAVTLAGGTVRYLHARRRHGYRPPIESAMQTMQSGRTPVDTVFLCNPNSPTGQAVTREVVLSMVRAAAPRRMRVLVDETFVEYCEGVSVLRDVPRFPNLLVLRSFTKFYALPALRLGYLVGSTRLMQRIRPLQAPWSVNMPAQTLAHAAFNDRRHAGRSLAFMQRERASLVRRLGALPGVTVYPSEANFLLLELPTRLSAHACVDALAEKGLLVRDCSAVPGLNRRTVRVAVRKPAHNRRLVAAFADLLGGRQ